MAKEISVTGNFLLASNSQGTKGMITFLSKKDGIVGYELEGYEKFNLKGVVTIIVNGFLKPNGIVSVSNIYKIEPCQQQ